MNVHYIYSESTGNRDGSSWLNAYPSYRRARKFIRPGDIVHWHPNHKEKSLMGLINKYFRGS